VFYEIHYILCTDDAVDVEIPIDPKTECCKVGAKSYIFASHEDLQITFSSPTGKIFLINSLFI